MEILISEKLIEKTNQKLIVWHYLNDDILSKNTYLSSALQNKWTKLLNDSYYSETNDLFFVLAHVIRISGIDYSETEHAELWIIDKTSPTCEQIEEPESVLYHLKTSIEFFNSSSTLNKHIKNFLNS